MIISVTCAIIRNEDDEILVVQRGGTTDHPYKWEFPGGKVAEGESEEECIIREVDEELAMEVVIFKKLPAVDHDYGFKHIRLIPFVCDTLSEIPLLSEHIDYKWLPATELLSVEFSEADVFVAKYYLKNIQTEPVSVNRADQNSSTEATDDEELQSMVNRMMSMKEADWLATSAGENPSIFLKLLDYSYSSDKKLAFHASWTLSKVCDKFPEIIYPYLPGIVEALKMIDNESTLRSFLRIISLCDLEKINKNQHGLLADFCFKTLNSGFSAIAVKAYSMEILYRLSLIYPELANELSVSIRILIEDGSAGIKARGQMILKKLTLIPVNPKSSRL